MICISDPLREEAKEVLSALRALGIASTVMLTGDSYRTAAAIAAQVGVDDFRAGVLPADKAEYVARLRREGHTVLMVGDGINDSPALSEADAGIAISDGAAIAREIADITIAADSLWELVELRRIAMDRLQRRPDCPWCGRCSAARHLCHAAQSLHPGRQLAEHEPAGTDEQGETKGTLNESIWAFLARILTKRVKSS